MFASIINDFSLCCSIISLLYQIQYKSDRGIQFTSEEYRELTEKMKRSYSKKEHHGIMHV